MDGGHRVWKQSSVLKQGSSEDQPLGKRREKIWLPRERVPEVLETSPNSPTWGGSREPQCTLGHQLGCQGHTQDLKEAEGKIHVTIFTIQQHNFPDRLSRIELALLEAISWLFKGRLSWVTLKTRDIAIRGKEIKSSLISSISGPATYQVWECSPRAASWACLTVPGIGSLDLGKQKYGFTYAGLYLWVMHGMITQWPNHLPP